MYYIENSENAVRYWSHRRLQLPGRLRRSAGFAELQAALASLTPQKGHLLSCRYWSNERHGNFDVENVLIYNPGPGRLASAAKNGITFSSVRQLPPVAPDGIYYEHLNEYTFQLGAQPEPKRIIESFAFPLTGMDRAKIWHSAASALAEMGPGIVGEFGLHATISSPYAISHANRLKQLFDGIITALQSDSTASDDAILRLAAHCRVTASEVRNLLGRRKPRLSVPLQKPLVGLTADGFILNPADHLCTEGTLVTTMSDNLQCAVVIYRNDVTFSEIAALQLAERPNATTLVNVENWKQPMKKPASQTNYVAALDANGDSLDAFVRWLSQQGYAPSSVRTFRSDARRVQAAYGYLDDLFQDDKLAAVTEVLRYSKADVEAGRPNPSKLDISVGSLGNMSMSIYNNLRAATSAVNAFRKFKVSR